MPFSFLHSYILRYFPYFLQSFQKKWEPDIRFPETALIRAVLSALFKLIHFFIRIIDTFIETFFPAENYLISDTRFHIKFSMKTFFDISSNAF